MRAILALPLMTALALCACGGGERTAADGDGATPAAAEAAGAAARGDGPQPGQYRVRTTILEMHVPGMPANTGAAMMNRMAEGMAFTYCLAQQDAAGAAREMARRSARGDCTIGKYEIAGGRIETEMTCTRPDGQALTVRTSGTVSREGMDVIAEFSSPEARQKMHVVHERIGDCPGA